MQIKIIKYKREILILAFLFAIVILIFYYRDLITEVVIKLLQVFSKLLDKLKTEAGDKIMKDFNSRYAELQNKAIKFGEGVAKKYITANAKSHRTAEKLFDEGLRRGQEAANAYIIEQFRNSENNTTNTSNFNMNSSTRVRELNEERNANYINEIYIILGYKKR